MSLYLTQHMNKQAIEDFLNRNYPDARICETELNLGEAQNLVRSICEDNTLDQPAVKLLSMYDAITFSALLGIALHWNLDFVAILTDDHRKSQFLFKSSSNHTKWTQLKLCFP